MLERLHKDEMERLEQFRSLNIFETECVDTDYLAIPGQPGSKIDQQPYYPVGSEPYLEMKRKE